MHLAYQFSRNESPELLSQTLWRLKISHRIVKSNGQDELWLSDARHQNPVNQLLAIWHDDPDKLSSVQASQTPSSVKDPSNIIEQMKASPATAVVLICSLLVAILTQLGSDISTLAYFTITPIEVFGGHIRFYSLSDVLATGEYWRLITPALLHFSVMHIVFNALWVWEVGRKLERLIGSIAWSVGFLVIAIASNVLQYQLTDNPLFGGLSGVVYGLIGFAWLMPILIKDWPTVISKQLMIFFMVWLGIGYTPVFEMIGLGSIANTAHTIGLLAGLVLGGVYWSIARQRYV